MISVLVGEGTSLSNLQEGIKGTGLDIALLDDFGFGHSADGAYIVSPGAETSYPFHTQTNIRAMRPSRLQKIQHMRYVAAWEEPPTSCATGVSSQIADSLEGYLRRLIADSSDEIFMDGMESRLSAGLKHLIGIAGRFAVSEIRSLMDSGELDIETIGEILRVLGAYDDQASHTSRLSILLDYLESHDPRIRDAALLGLASLDDTSAICALKKALEKEPVAELREDLQEILRQLLLVECLNF